MSVCIDGGNLSMRIKILGKTWTLEFHNYLGAFGSEREHEIHGLCDSPDTPNRKIKIRKGLSPKDEMNCILHECLHAANYKTYSEEYVDELATNLSEILWKLNFRKIK